MWWKVLGVQRGADLSEIKAAYSTLIKTYRPNTHPEEFAKIREAFEHARKQCRQTKRSSPKHVSLNIDETLGVDVKGKSKPDEVELAFTANDQNTVREMADLSESISAPKEDVFQMGQIGAREQVNHKAEEASSEDRIYKKNETHSESDNWSSKKSEQVPDEEYSTDRVIELLDKWKQSHFKDEQVIEHVINHPLLNDYNAFRSLSHMLISWLHQELEIKQGLLAKKSNIPVAYLAKLDKIFGWTQREQQVFREHGGRSLNVLFALIHEGHNNWDYVSSLNKESHHRVNQGPVSKARLLFLGLLQLVMAAAFAPLTLNDPEISGGIIFVWFIAYLFLDGLGQFAFTKAIAGLLRIRKTSIATYVSYGVFWLKYGVLGCVLLFIGLLPISAGCSVTFIMLSAMYEELTKVENTDFALLAAQIGLMLFFIAVAIAISKRILNYARREYASALIEYWRI